MSMAIPPDTAPSDGELLAAGRFLAVEGIFGLVWVDADLVATRRLGPVSEVVPLGERVTEGVLALMGFEQRLADLRHAWQRPVVVPNVQLDPRSLDAPRFNISVHWLPEAGHYVLLLGRVLSRSGVEDLLEAQVRLRRIAEAEVEAQKKLLERANAELSRANADLGAFASVISHDLRAPLRFMRYLAEDAKAALARGDDAAALAFLERSAAQTRRMGAMLSGLLTYSRIGRKAEVVAEVDTGVLVREIAESTDRPEGISVSVSGTWPVLATLAQPLDIVVRNLVDNSVKHHDRATGEVRIGAEPNGDFLTISVADDGPGIPPEWQEAIFLPFRRIGDDADPAAADGAGLGLALVRRTVDMVGGAIDVISDPAVRRGTTIRVQWPKTIAV